MGETALDWLDWEDATTAAASSEGAMAEHAAHYTDRASARRRMASLIRDAMERPSPSATAPVARLFRPTSTPMQPRKRRVTGSREEARLWAALDRLGNRYERSENIFVDACTAIRSLRRTITILAMPPIE